jgi:V/A-type H+-transporting ATPase subunit C
MEKGRIISDESYSIVKSFSAKGQLIPKSTLEALSEAKDLEDLSNRLKGTTYNQFVSNISLPISARKLEIAFIEHLASFHHSLIRVSPKPNFLSDYYLKYIIWNLKTVLKSRALNKGYDEIVSHINLFAEELVGRRDLLVKALSAKDLDEAAKMLQDSEFGSEILSALKVYKKNKEIQVFDIYLDHAFYQGIGNRFEEVKKIESLKKTSSEAEKNRDIIASDIDSYNFLSILRGKLWKLDINQINDLIVKPLFDIPLSVINSMIKSESINDILNKLTLTKYRMILPKDIEDFNDIGKIEDAFNKYSFKIAMRPFTRQTFGTGVSLGIIKLKEIEIRNLSSIAFGVEKRIGSTSIVEKLISTS